LLKEEAHCLLEPGVGLVGAVWRDQDVFEFVDGVAGWDWLLLKDIQTRAFDLSIRESTHQSSLVDNGSAADVYDNSIGLHRSEGGIADHVMGFRGEGRRDNYVVACGEHCGEFCWRMVHW